MTEQTPLPPPHNENDSGEPLHRPYPPVHNAGLPSDPLADTIQHSDTYRPQTAYQYLSPEAINAWRISGFMGSLFYWIIPIGYGIVAIGTGLPGWPVWVLAALFIILTISEASWLPWLRWKKWRYRVDEHEIDLQQGIFVVTRTLIPVKRVQHVDTRQGPIYRSFELASVTITTAGDTHEIPALSESVADEDRKSVV